MDFKEFKEKYYGKETIEIATELQKEEGFWKNDKNVAQICVDIDRLIESIISLEKEQPSLYLINKKMIMYKYILENFTTLTSFPEDGDFNSFDLRVDEVIYLLNAEARFIKTMVDEGLKELQGLVLDKLYGIFNDGIPNGEELDELQNKFSNILNEVDPENLKMFEKIMEFNDPSLKAIRDEIYESKVSKDFVEKTKKDIENKIK